MSLKTRCPACDTVFKIVPDQLKVSKGWVRCGRCAEVFDAAAHAATPDEASPVLQPMPSKATVKNTAAIIKSKVIAPKNIAGEAVNTLVDSKLLPIKEGIETNLSFVRVAKNKAFWEQKNIVIGLYVACFGLAGVLFFQLVLTQRHHLVAANPSLAANFESICKLIGCNIEPLKNIDAFKIDSSSFNKTPNVVNDSSRAEAFALKVSIKNNIDIPLAIPSIELTLTDSGDKPVLRRVFPAKELGFQGATVGAHGDWASEATIVVTPNPAASPISGYRVLLFYP
jgi:predicted Zn finger-like uncharacterized protein